MAKKSRTRQYFQIGFCHLDDDVQTHLRRLARDYLELSGRSTLDEERLWTKNFAYWTEAAAR